MLKRIFIILYFIFAFCAKTEAHPHLFIDPYTTVVFNQGSLSGIQVAWKWDEMWSEQVLLDCDKNMDSIISAEENKIVEKDYFQGVSEYGYFMEIILNGKVIKVSEVQDFKTTVKNGIVTYHFFVPINNVLKSGALTIKYNDPTIYTSFGVNKSFLQTKSTEFDVSGKNVTRLDYYGCMMSLNFQKKG